MVSVKEQNSKFGSGTYFGVGKNGFFKEYLEMSENDFS
jgi:hypothetical protein